jgi:hypothetical protein
MSAYWNELVERLGEIDKILDAFALLEQFKGNPDALADLWFEYWKNLPAEIARLVEERVETSYELDHLVNRAMRERGQNRIHLKFPEQDLGLLKLN